jgi:hypothetical protein
MAGEIDPFIRGKLLAFRGRFRLLVFFRGACCGVLFFLAALLVLAIADWVIVMDDRTRYGLSGAVYLIGLLTTWFLCVRPLLKFIDERELAAMIEEEKPSLHAELLSAVELSGDGEGLDSKSLRRQARERVIEKLHGLDTTTLMPKRLVKTCIIAVVVALTLMGATGGMAAFESGRTLLVRALVPMANVDRVSRNKITVLAPKGGDAAVPENDSLVLQIKVTGPALEERPLLETKVVGAKEPDERSVFMEETGTETYSSSIAMGRHEVRYRILAGDAVSRWFMLKSVPRPYVMVFSKKYIYPKYTGREPLLVSEEAGDLSALFGTEVELSIRLDQPVATASLHLMTETKTNDVDFAQSGGAVGAGEATEWSLSLPVTESGAFTVHVKTAGGLDNKFRPEYSINARPDLVPTIKVTEPKGEIIARPEDILPVVGEASDDVGLEKIEQLIKVNQQPWTTNALKLAEALGTNVTFKLDWDLLKLAAKPGDMVMTKLAVVDLKGSRAESSPVRLKVDSSIFEAKRIAAIERQRQWTTNLVTAAEKTIEFHELLPGDLEKFILPGKDAERRKKAAEALKALDEARAKWKLVRQRVPASMRKAHAGRETAGLGLMGRVALRMDADWLPRARLHLRPLEGIVVDAKVQAHAEYLPDVLAEVKASAGQLQSTANGWLAADEAALALDLLDYISRAIANMHRLAETDRDIDPKVWERLSRRQGSVAKELEVVLATLKPLASRLPGGRGDDIEKLRAALAAAHSSFVEKLKVAPDEKLLAVGRDLEKAVLEAAGKLRPLAPVLAEAAAEARVDLEKSVGTTGGAVKRLQSAMEAREQAAKDYEKAKQDGVEILKADAKRKAAGELLDLHWTLARDMLRGRARLEESGKANAMFVSDTAQAAAAIGAVRAGVEAGRDVREVLAQLEGIAKAITTLEAAHELTVLETAIKSLAARERWEKKSTDANSLRPRDWQWLRQRMSVTPDQLRAVGLGGASELEDAAGSDAAKAVAAEMSERKQNPGIFPIEKSPK